MDGLESKTRKRRIVIRVQRPYLLIVGCPRSGTTLLASMVGCHTRVGMLNEDVSGKWMNKILGKPIAANKLCIPNQIQMKRGSVFSRRLFKKLGFIEEAPRSIFSLEEYLEVPTLKIVAIIRDGNDAIASMMNRGGSTLRTGSNRWVTATDTIYELRTRYPDRVLVIAFEHLLLEPQASLNEVCNFLEIAYEEEMLHGCLYNPRYPETKLNENKVHRYLTEHNHFQLAERFPSTFRKYQALLGAAAKAALRSPPLVFLLCGWGCDFDPVVLSLLFG